MIYDLKILRNLDFKILITDLIFDEIFDENLMNF